MQILFRENYRQTGPMKFKSEVSPSPKAGCLEIQSLLLLVEASRDMKAGRQQLSLAYLC